MTEIILNLLLKGAEIFHDERRLSLSKELKEKYSRVQKEKNKRFPNFNNDRLALAEQNLHAFLIGYKKELDERMGEVLNKVYSND